MIRPRSTLGYLLNSVLVLVVSFGAFAQENTAKPQAAAGKAKHVLIVVMDGLRRDAVVPEDMPTLSALAKSGTFFAAHHPVYLSTTEVNGTALATGMTPARSGVMANREYRPDVDLLRPVDTQGQWAAWKGDQSGPWIRTPTLPELARAAGMRTAVAGTKAVAMMWDRSLKNRTADSPAVFEGRSIPSAILDTIQDDFGPLPPGVDWKHFTNAVQDDWTARVLTEKLWANGVPPLSVLWLSEPDFSQHGTGPGSAQSKQGLRSSDDRLATALAALEKHGVRDQTDVVVTSDHGFSTIYRAVDIPKALQRAGFKASGEFFKTPENGSVLVIGLGGTVSLYVIGHDAAVREKLLAYLQTSDWAGVIFTREGSEGTFKLSDVGIDSPTAPDLVVSLKWKDETRINRMPGTVVATGMDVGQGTHGTLSKYDMGNTLIMAGPDVKAGLRNMLPSANSDVAPTVAYLLGIPGSVEHPMDGRVLGEALTVPAPRGGDARPPQTTVTQAKRTLIVGEKKEKKEWGQYIKVTTYAGRRYIDEGNTTVQSAATSAPTTAASTRPASRPAGAAVGRP
jgi:predicted AlkP superfamily pyrophosphatase or phosphodiesterase